MRRFFISIAQVFLACAAILYLLSIESLYYDIRINSQGELYFNGPINKKRFKEVQNIYNESIEKPKLLVINSTGGFGTHGIQFANWLIDNEFDVKVEKKCLSSCANYVFPAGKQSILSRDSVLGFHGGFRSKKLRFYGEDERRMVTSREWREKLGVEEYERGVAMEIQLYERMNVDPNIALYGESPIYDEYHNGVNYDAGYDWFYYSVSDLKKMGIKVELSDSVWEMAGNDRYGESYKVVAPKPHAD